jgi:RNA polymerase sigma-70 factor (ECF subfamily)
MAEEEALRALWQAGDRAALVTRVMQVYGREILGYLIAALSGDGEAGDAFSQFTLNLWQASERFRGESSFRTWAYALARHAAGRVIRERGKRRGQVGLSSVPELDAMAQRVRSETVEWLRSETRSRVQAIRETLDPDDQTLLILRVDRGFTWPEVARIMADGEGDLGKKTVALRKRFERIKETLRRSSKDPGHT